MLDLQKLFLLLISDNTRQIVNLHRMHEERISRSTLYESPLVSRTNLEFLTEQRRVQGITPAPLRAVVRLQSFSTMQTVHSAATGHETPREMQHQLIYAPVWKSQRGDAIRLEGRLVDVT